MRIGVSVCEMDSSMDGCPLGICENHTGFVLPGFKVDQLGIQFRIILKSLFFSLLYFFHYIVIIVFLVIFQLLDFVSMNTTNRHYNNEAQSGGWNHIVWSFLKVQV